MSKMPVFFILVFFIIAVPTASGFGAEIIRETPLLRDGFVMMGVDGKLIGPDSNDVWFFELSSDVNDYRAVIKAGTRLELLPSSALEKMTADKIMRTTAAYRLWNSRVTKYKGRNFIFPNFFLPLAKAKTPPQKQDSSTDTVSEPEPRRELAIDDPNDVLSMPQEVIEKLRLERSALSVLRSAKNTEHSTQHAARSTNSVFVDRTALLVKQDDGRLVFVPDALGRNVQQLSLHLLPCEALELTERKQSAETETVRFKIAGIMTKYKGNNYLLLEKATRAYSHGNFGR